MRAGPRTGPFTWRVNSLRLPHPLCSVILHVSVIMGRHWHASSVCVTAMMKLGINTRRYKRMGFYLITSKI